MLVNTIIYLSFFLKLKTLDKTTISKDSEFQIGTTLLSTCLISSVSTFHMQIAGRGTHMQASLEISYEERH